MANYSGAARTNFFRVVDEAAGDELKAWCEKTGNVLHTHASVPLCFMVSGESESGDFNFGHEDENGEDEHLWWDTVCHVLAEGECLVAVASGAEKLCYVSGHALAMKADGSHVSLSLYDIYDMARKTLGINPTVAEYTTHSQGA